VVSSAVTIDPNARKEVVISQGREQLRSTIAHIVDQGGAAGWTTSRSSGVHCGLYMSDFD